MADYNPIKLAITRSDGVTGLDENHDMGFGLTELMGIEYPTPEIFTANKGLGDGAFITGKRLEARTVELHMKAKGRTPAEIFAARRQAMRFFDPNYSFDLAITFDDFGASAPVTRTLKDCEITAISLPTVQTDTPQPDLTIQFLAPSAYFEGATHTETETDATTWTVTSDADTRSRFVMNITVKSATAYILYVTANGGERADIYPPSQSNFYVGDVVTIDTATATVYINGANPYPLPAYAAQPIFDSFWINPGTNTFVITSHPGNSAFDVTIEYTERWLGV